MIDTSGNIDEFDTSKQLPKGNDYFLRTFRVASFTNKTVTFTLNPLTTEDKKNIKEEVDKFEEELTRKIRAERFKYESNRSKY